MVMPLLRNQAGQLRTSRAGGDGGVPSLPEAVADVDRRWGGSSAVVKILSNQGGVEIRLMDPGRGQGDEVRHVSVCK